MNSDTVLGCLMGGAIGDSLGNPAEQLSAEQLAASPVTFDSIDPAQFRITDDTQMTLFTAEGFRKFREEQDVLELLYAYHRWLTTQGSSPATGDATVYADRSDEEVRTILSDGSLVHEEVLNRKEGPGATCLEALATGEFYSPAANPNDSKGCGGVMRAAPIGLLAGSREEAYRFGKLSAALTHGHPTGYIAAGAFAVLIHGLSRGESLGELQSAAVELIREKEGEAAEETARATENAASLAASLSGQPSAAEVARLGEGWVAEETLAIALFCALAHPEDPRAALELAVNHGGDSDSTASLCGNLLGAKLGAAALGRHSLYEQVNAKAVIERTTDEALKGDPA